MAALITVGISPDRQLATRGRARAALFGVLAALLLAGTAADAGEIDTGVPDLQLRFDNTLRYNIGLRTDPIDEKIGGNPAFTAGEYSIQQYHLSTNRLDLLSELDLSYRGRYGARVSGAGWYDHVYREGTVSRSPALAAVPGTYVGNELSDYALDRYRGPWGELLDAFAFARLDLRGVPVTVKAGRHTVYWGESLMQAGNIHGVAYAQMPLDQQKGSATPGVEAKELFRPLANVSASAQLTPALSISGQVFLEWQSAVYPEGGTFLAPSDAVFDGPDGSPAPPAYRSVAGYLKNGKVSWPRDAGDLGVAVRWSPEWLDGTLGAYYRRYTDKLAAVLVTSNPGGVGPLSPDIPSPYQYRQYYGEDVDLFGVSLAKQLLGASVGAEVSFRHDTPLLAQALGFAVAPTPEMGALLFPTGQPRLTGNSYQARGDTLHALVNALGVISGVPVFSSAAWAVELTYVRWLDVRRENRDMFYAEGYGVCRTDPALAQAGLARTWRDGCATRDSVAVGASFTPTWFRVFSGVDLLLPLAASWTVYGNAPVTLGGNQGSGSYGVGIAADVRNGYRFDLKYVDYFGSLRDDGTRVTSSNGMLGLLKSRGNVTFTAKTTF